MSPAEKENTYELSGTAPGILMHEHGKPQAPAAKTTSFRRALASKPTNGQQPNYSSTFNGTKRARISAGNERTFAEQPLGLPNFQSAHRNSSYKTEARPSIARDFDDEEGDTEDEGDDAGVGTPLASLAARRSLSRSKVFYPRPQWPKDLSQLELDFVSEPKELSPDEEMEAFFETMRQLYPAPSLPELTMDNLPDLEVDFSSDEDISLLLRTPEH